MAGDTMRAVWSVASSTGRAGGRVGSNAPRPLPSTLRGFSILFMVQDLFCESDITFGALGAGIVADDGLAEAGGLGEPDTAGDYSAEHLIMEELFQVGSDLAS